VKVTNILMKKAKRKITDFASHRVVSYDELRGESYKDWVLSRKTIMDRYRNKLPKKPTSNCIVCGTESFKFLFEKEGFNFVQCQSCELIQVNPMPDPTLVDEFYNTPEYVKFVRQHMTAKSDYRKNRFGEERVVAWEEILGPHSSSAPRKCLDVGCGSGFVLEAALDHGWEAYGLDLNSDAVEEARKRGLRAFSEKLETVSADRFGLFDVITMYDVLEHSYDPNAMVQAASRLLVDDGLVVIYVPNWESTVREILGINTFWIWGIFHLSYFTLETLGKLVEQNGFQIIEYETQGLDWADITWWRENVEGRNVGFLKKHLELLQFTTNESGLGAGLRLYLKKFSHEPLESSS
jgi:2-polyprenyl-3-methyl-5-hydroxy-6-metoxy-1,4-benzoquinol methylase